MSDVERYTNPQIVRKNVDKHLGKDVPLYYSTHMDKKYMIKDPHGKWVHFGQYGYTDFSRHQNIKRRELFRKRNAKWAMSPKWSAAWLSYHLLW